MAATRQKRDLLSSRRRTGGEDGDEYDIGADSDDDDSQSEGSVLTVEESTPLAKQAPIDGTLDDTTPSQQQRPQARAGVSEVESPGASQGSRNDAGSQPRPVFTSTAEVEAMAKGLQIDDNTIEEEAVDFEDTVAEVQSAVIAQPRHQAGVKRNAAPRVSNSQARGMRSGQQDTRQRNKAGQADTSNAGLQIDSKQPPLRPSGRGVGRGDLSSFNASRQPQRAVSQGFPANNDRWNHDLHEAILKPPVVETPPANQHSTQHAYKPNALSRSIALGSVAARIFLPFMEAPKVLDTKIAVRQHTRLPDSRPPLRRDKPVRISIPGHAPRFVFPTTERSFIFIPRAQRPNQQAKIRGRGGYMSRGGSRRTSIYGGSAYSPSGAVSRRSSMVFDGMMTPQGHMFSRPPGAMPTGPARPVVRLPGQQNPHSSRAMSVSSEMYNYGRNSVSAVSDATYPLPSEPVKRGHRSSQMDMHHPRPQKQLSVASIEGEQQAFHQQLPFNAPSHLQVDEAGASHMGYAGEGEHGTPLPNIPESAINAQPFMPATMPPPYFGYPIPPMYYYPSTEDAQQGYGAAQLGGTGYMAPANYYMPMTVPSYNASGDAAHGGGQFMQDNQGMMYYYDAMQEANPAAQTMMPEAYFTPATGMNYYTPQ